MLFFQKEIKLSAGSKVTWDWAQTQNRQKLTFVLRSWDGSRTENRITLASHLNILFSCPTKPTAFLFAGCDATVVVADKYKGFRRNCYFYLNPFVTSGTYISHLQRVFSSPLG
jgi:hypothetical protein